LSPSHFKALKDKRRITIQNVWQVLKDNAIPQDVYGIDQHIILPNTVNITSTGSSQWM
jgi:hypothetical protein